MIGWKSQENTTFCFPDTATIQTLRQLASFVKLPAVSFFWLVFVGTCRWARCLLSRRVLRKKTRSNGSELRSSFGVQAAVFPSISTRERLPQIERDSQAPGQRSKMTRSQTAMICGFAAIVLLLNAFAWFCATSKLSQIEKTVESSDRGTSASIRKQLTASRSNQPPGGLPANLNVPGIAAPALCQPDDVKLPDDVRVIGVEIDGNARAYVVKAFEVRNFKNPGDVAVHIVNDTINNQPFCVTHCDLTHSTRVLADSRVAKNSPTAIDLRVGGWADEMILVLSGVRYLHHAETLPLADVPFTTTNWGQWRADHPKTLVYTGRPCIRPALSP